MSPENSPIGQNQNPSLAPTLPASETLSLGLDFNAPPAGPVEVQSEIPLVTPPKEHITWGQRTIELERAIQAKGDSSYASRNLLILQLWSDRARGDRTVLERICRYAKTNKFVIEWVLKMARKGDYDRLVCKSKPGRKGKRKQVLMALSQGLPAKEIEVQFGIHRTSVLRAQQQLKRLGGKIAA